MTHTDLKPCPFCGGKPEIVRKTAHFRKDRRIILVHCGTEDCLGRQPEWEDQGGYERERDTEAEAITAWNTRTPDTAPSHGNLIVETEIMADEADHMRLPVLSRQFRRLITALRAAEGQVNTVWDTIRHYQDCAKAAEARELVLSDALRAAEAREQKLREALEPFVAILECGCSFTEDDADTDVWFVNYGCRLTVGHFRAARRALGGSNET